MTSLRLLQFPFVALALATAVLAGCSRGNGRGGMGVGEPCTAEVDCAKGLTCTAGVCALPPGAQFCTPGARLCDGPDVVQCDATGQGISVIENCPNGCKNGACEDPACTLGARRCASDGIEQCTLDATGEQSWHLVQPCPAGCDPATNACIPLTCNPLATRCSPSAPATVQTCSADGSAWVDQPCGTGQTCQNGACALPNCTIGDQRCAANGIEACTAVPNGAPVWQLVQACPLGCDSSSSTCVQLACKPLDVRCSPTAPNTVQSCKSDGSGWADGSACASGAQCSQGVCIAQACTPNAASCDGNNLVVCDAQGSGTTSTTACPHGCQNGACIQGVCTPGSTQCANGSVQTCSTDGSGFTQTQDCGGNSCEVVQGNAVCGLPVCTPLSRRCGPDGNSVQTCLADGSGWTQGDSCGVGGTCSNGVCSAPPATCADGALRCQGASVQQCEKSTWSTIGQCLGSCTGGGVCSGGSCGAQVAVNVPLPSCATSNCPPPADGVSSLLAVIGPLVDSAGSPLPDGMLVTVAVTGGAQIAPTADADPVTPGIQVRTVSGYADVAFTAPPASNLSSANNLAHVVISAQIGQGLSCTGSAAVDFAPASGFAYAAEDFTSAQRRDFAATTADWRTDPGIAESRNFLFGTGSDGPLALASGTTWDLSQTPRGTGLPPFAPSLQVIGLDPQAAQVQGNVAGFAPGDEVLLIELQGASLASTSAAGSWELLTVASVADGTLSFTAPVLGTYASTPRGTLAGEKVVLQRIPQFTNVSVPSGSTITSSAWDGTQGGIVAFRANGTVTVAGSISADALGYRAGVASGGTLNQPGESYGGQPAPAAALSVRNAGAGGGGYLLCDPAHLDQLDSWYGAGGSYGTAGLAGSSNSLPSGRVACASTQGLPYGSPTLARLFPGSGSGTQQFNSHGPCNVSTCPGESRGPGYIPANPSGLDYPAAFAASGAQLPTTFSFCSAEAKTYGKAYQTGGASSCDSSSDSNGNTSCAQTFNQCGTLASTFNGSSQTFAHTSFNYPVDAPCTSVACNDTGGVCAADTKSYGAAWFQTGASSCDTTSNPSCAQTFANCSATGDHDYTFASSTCLAGTTCSSTFSAGNCGQIPNRTNGFTTSYGSYARPCNGNSTCLAAFAACAGNVVSYTTNTSACVAACPGLTGAANYTKSCTHCGCGAWNGRSCYEDDGSCGTGSYCYQTGTVYDGCEALCKISFSCPRSDDTCTSTGCGCVFGVCFGSPCYRPQYFCEDGTGYGVGRCPGDGNADCNSCSICQGAAGTSCATNPGQSSCDASCETTAGCSANPGCQHNPGCSINPGCSTNAGCSTNTGCETCGGRNTFDGNSCDFTNPSNACRCPLPWTDETQGGRGGGILFVAASSLDLSGGGVVSARGGAPGVNGKPGFAGGSGGSLWVRAGTIKLAARSPLQFDASGGVNAGAGRVRLENAGITAVPAQSVSPAPYVPAFSLQQAQSTSILPASTMKATAVELVPLADPATTSLIEGTSPQVVQQISIDGGKTFTALGTGTLTPLSAATGDLRFREIFSPKPGAHARTAGLVWLIQLQ